LGNQLGQGSGFVVGDPGSIATNYHVMYGASTAKVAFNDGSKRAVLGYSAADQERDAVLLHLDGEFGKPLPLAQSERLQVGDDVVVIGAPRGFEQTVTTGVSSGLVELQGVEWLQFSALVSPGSSGSPVLNRSAEVVGMVTRNSSAEPQLNFAVPSDVLLSLVESPDSILPLAQLTESIVSSFTEEQAGWLRSLPTADRTLEVESTVDGQLTSDDEIAWDGTYAQAWQLESGDTIGIYVDLVSEEFDSFLMVLPPDSGAPLYDDDGGGACNSRVFIDRPVHGEYTVVVNAMSEEGVGGFRLRAAVEALPLTEGPCEIGLYDWFLALPADNRIVGREEERFGTLTSRDSLWSQDNTRMQGWDLVLDTAGSVTVDLISQEFDAYLYVFPPEGEMVSDDDAGGACNSRVTIDNAESGTYRIVVNAVYQDQIGAFRLRITDEPGPLAKGECGGLTGE